MPVAPQRAPAIELAVSHMLRLADGVPAVLAEAAARSDQGCIRDNNEDRVGLSLIDDALLLVVADGMGGHAAGEVAAQLAVDILHEECAMRAEQPAPKLLRQAMEVANSIIRAQGETNPAEHGMGTTATALLLKDRQAWFAHVGDSRLYLWRDGTLMQLSEDHSLVAEMVRGGLLRPEDAVEHPCRNIIVRALGSASEILPQAPERPLPTLPGDVFLLCSDGLHDMVADDELAGCLAAAPTEACRALVDLARERGGPDNISAIVCRLTAA